MMNRFLSLGDSTKDHSNEAIGGLGYGCKSPLAAVHQYTVTSWHDGMKSVYVVTFDRVSPPHINCTYREPTDEPTGLMVQWDAERKNHFTYLRKLQQFVKRMPTLPNVVGNQEYSGAKIKYDMEGDGWAKLEVCSGVSNAIMGIVAYPIDKDMLGTLTDEQTTILSLGLDIFFPIGSLEIAHSREGLGYDDVTIQRIKRKLDKISVELSKKVEHEFASCSTLFEARRAKSEMSGRFMGGAYNKIVDKFAKFNGQPIDTSIRLTSMAHDGANFFELTDDFRQLKNPNLNTRLRDRLYIMFSRVDGVLYVDEPKGAGRKLQECDVFKHPLVVTGGADAFKRVHEALGHPPYKYVSELPKPAPLNSTKNKVALIKEFKGWHWSDARRTFSSSPIYEWKDANVNLSDNGYYVPLYGTRPCRDDHSESSPSLGADSFAHMIEGLRAFGLLPKDAVVYGLPASHKKMVDKPEFAGWTNIFNLMKTRFDELTNDTRRIKQTQRLQDQHEKRVLFYDYLGEIMRRLRQSVDSIPSGSPLLEIYDIWTESNADLVSSLHDEWMYLGKYLERKCPLPASNTARLKALIVSFNTKYPMLRHAPNAPSSDMLAYIRLVEGA
jgi:hypothetical protein